MGTDLKYGKDIRGQLKVKRHPLNVLFDPFYPIIVAALITMALFWYLGIPISKLIDGMSFNAMPNFLRKWLP